MVIEGRSSIFLILDRDSFFNSVVNNVSFHLIILNIISAPRSLTAPDQNQLKKKNILNISDSRFFQIFVDTLINHVDLEICHLLYV